MFKLISAVVVLAFTITSIIQNPSYAQELKLAPQSRMKDIPQALPLAHQIGMAATGLAAIFIAVFTIKPKARSGHSIRTIAGDFAVATIVITAIFVVIMQDLVRSLLESGHKIKIRKPVVEEDESISMPPSADGLPRPLPPSSRLPAISRQSP